MPRAEEIAKYLQEHPEFFEEYAELLSSVHVPHPHGSHAIPLAERQVLSLREKSRALEGKLRELVQFGEENDVISDRVHRLTVALLGARDLPGVLRTLDEQLRGDFGVPAVALRLWWAPSDGSRGELEALSEEARVFSESLANPYFTDAAMFESASWFGPIAADLRSFVPPAGHPAMVKSLVDYGTAVIEVDGGVLLGKFIDETGAILDSFRIEKGTAGCPATALGGCSPAGKGKLTLKDDATDDAKDRVGWKWQKAPVDPADLDPIAGSDLRLCVWDATGNVLDLGAPNTEALNYPTDPAAAPSWSWVEKKPGFFAYSDAGLSADGLHKIKLKTGANASLSIKAKGLGAAVPAPPLALPVTTQLVNSDTGECWSVDVTDVRKNGAGRFVAKSP